MKCDFCSNECGTIPAAWLQDRAVCGPCYAIQGTPLGQLVAYFEHRDSQIPLRDAMSGNCKHLTASVIIQAFRAAIADYPNIGLYDLQIHTASLIHTLTNDLSNFTYV